MAGRSRPNVELHLRHSPTDFPVWSFRERRRAIRSMSLVKQATGMTLWHRSELFTARLRLTSGVYRGSSVFADQQHFGGICRMVTHITETVATAYLLDKVLPQREA